MGLGKSIKKAKKASKKGLKKVSKASAVVSKQVGKPMQKYGSYVPPPYGTAISKAGTTVVESNKWVQTVNTAVQGQKLGELKSKPITLSNGKVIQIPVSSGKPLGLFGWGNFLGFL